MLLSNEDEREAGPDDVPSTAIPVDASLKTRARQDEITASFSQRALAGLDVAALLGEATTLVVHTLGVDVGAVTELTADDFVVLAAGAGLKPSALGRPVGSLADAHWRYTLRSTAPVVVEDYANDKRFDTPGFLRDHGAVSGASAVIEGHGRPFGMISAHTVAKRAFTSDDLHFLQAIARVLAAAIERKRFERELTAVRDELSERLADQTRLLELTSRLAKSVELPLVLDEVLAAAAGLLHTSMGVLRLVEPDSGLLYPAASVGFPDECLALERRGEGAVGPCLAAMEARASVWVDDVESDTRFAASRETARVAGYRGVHSTPLVSRGGEILGAVALYFRHPYRPTERRTRLLELYVRQAAEFIENARQHACAQVANQEKDGFLAALSHELRTPLQSMIGWIRLLRRGTLDAGNADRALETIERNVLAQTKLIDDLLDVSRIISGKLLLDVRTTRLAEVVEAAVDVARPTAAAKQIHVECSIEPDVPPVTGDPQRLQQVVANLLTNAVKFTPEGGTIRVALERSGSQAEIRVTDTGIGIDHAFLPHIFERFRQADGTSSGRGGGLGMGLAIVRHLVDLHGGSVSAESSGRGLGAAFTVRLPLAGLAGRGLGHAREEAPPDLLGTRVLLVDDESDAREPIRVVLEQCGADVLTASSAAEALEALDWFGPHVIVSDISMPGGDDGYAFMAKVRARVASRAVPAVALTAHAKDRDRRQALAAGFDMHVAKPAEPYELAQAVAQLAWRHTRRRRRQSTGHPGAA